MTATTYKIERRCEDNAVSVTTNAGVFCYDARQRKEGANYGTKSILSRYRASNPFIGSRANADDDDETQPISTNTGQSNYNHPRQRDGCFGPGQQLNCMPNK